MREGREGGGDSGGRGSRRGCGGRDEEVGGPAGKGEVPREVECSRAKAEERGAKAPGGMHRVVERSVQLRVGAEGVQDKERGVGSGGSWTQVARSTERRGCAASRWV